MLVEMHWSIFMIICKVTFNGNIKYRCCDQTEKTLLQPARNTIDALLKPATLEDPSLAYIHIQQ